MGTLCLVLVILQLSWSLSSSVAPPSSHLCLPHQRDALLHFKTTISVDCDYYFDGDVYPKIDIESWNKSIDCCSWEGVECDNVTGHVIGIDLSHSCLVGSLFANNSLFQLQNLQWLDLSFNRLGGSLLENTSSLFHFHGLQRLNLADNFFYGTISSNLFSQLVSLTHLNLSYNGFYGLIPHQTNLLASLVSLDLSFYSFELRFDGQGFDMLARNLTKLRNLVLDHADMSDVALTSFLNLSSSLEHLSLSRCNLLGEFPTQVFQLPNLKVLDLSMNENLTGYLPNTSWSSGLELLDLSHCGFRGSIPASFGNLTQIISVDLKGNSLEGQIPDVFGNLRTLTSLSFSSCNFSGPLPITIFNLTKITRLDLINNHLEGPLPNHVSELQFLEELLLYNNSISGGVPSWLFALPSLLELDLSCNKLVGPIDRIQKLSSIQFVHLRYNNIGGSIPYSIFDLVNLISLDLSSNNLSGPIPGSIFDLVNLHSLNLSSNKLSGPLPDFNCDLVNLTSLDLSSNNLSGPIPDFNCDLVSLTSLDLSSNNLSGVIKSDMLSKLTSLEFLYVSSNSLLSLSTSGNDVNYSFPRLESVNFSGCSVRQFPNFFRTSNLKSLDLSNNMISGGISKWEAEGWEVLIWLDLSHNFLTALEQFPGNNLRYLNLHSNLLQGPILSTCLNPQIPILRGLEFFIISENKLTGNFPASICNLSSLVLLDLSENSLSGIIPDCLENLSHLEILDLQMNNFIGKIPNSFVNNRLRRLLLNDNRLEGLVPSSLANSTSLELLNLGNNKLMDRFPHWLASISSLQVLILRFNRFYGSLPHSIASSDFSALRIIDLSANEFTGTLSTKLLRNLRAMKDKPRKWLTSSNSYLFGMIKDSFIYEIPVNVTTKRLEIELRKTWDIFISMDLSNNQFFGEIPEDVGQLISLQMLNFSHNNFTGPIPASFGNLVALESLDLSSNKLNGGIPSQMTNLTFLEVLNLSNNNFVGPIPYGNQFDTFDNDSYNGNLGLCGLPLSKQCINHQGPDPPSPLVVEHEGSKIPFFWQVVMMGYGSGVVIGLSLGYIVFTTGRPWWFVRKVERDWQYNFTKWVRRNKGRRN
ncbi:receptor-like protein Cf-9 [Gossypium arboreum]|uniref:receptor-like protein Cf-9 n=1 Tax=Gossypium arboreum TaxID=29729 RepID=UPI0022F16412|nr:receptor-like protein Cf-9 [Gossypium arboreum]